MPSIQEILTVERAKRPGAVVLFEEGMFLRAYEESACRLAQQYGLKVSCRRVKSVGETVASVGFPKSSAQKYLPHYGQEDGHVVAEGIAEGATPFAEWKAAAEQVPQQAGVRLPQGADWLREAVMRFPVESKTPVECMLFLTELKTRLSNGKG